MQDLETQAVLDRVQDRSSWAAGWLICGVVTLLVLVRIFFDWHTRDLTGKIHATGMIAFLILLPGRLIVQRRGRRPISAGWLFVIAYVLLMFGMQTFGRQ